MAGNNTDDPRNMEDSPKVHNRKRDQQPVLSSQNRDEEMATEMTVDDTKEDLSEENDEFSFHSATGWIGLVLSILSFFTLPLFFGLSGIIFGIIARSRNAAWLGNAAVTAGVISIVLSFLINFIR